MLIVEIIVFPVFCILFNISLYQPELIIVVVLVTLGFSTLGTVFSALVANMRSREVILAVLFLPVVVPVLIAAVEMTDYVLNGGRVNEIMKWGDPMRIQRTSHFIVSLMVFNEIERHLCGSHFIVFLMLLNEMEQRQSGPISFSS